MSTLRIVRARRAMARAIERGFREQGFPLAGDGGWEIGDRVETAHLLTGELLEMRVVFLGGTRAVAEDDFDNVAELDPNPENTEALRLPRKR